MTSRRLAAILAADVVGFSSLMGQDEEGTVIAVSDAGGLGSLPCGMLSPDQIRIEIGIIRQRTSRPVNLNFFCHQPPEPGLAAEHAWKERLKPYYEELDLDTQAPTPASTRLPFNPASCDLVEEFRPEVVSFHFGLPERSLLDRIRATGAKIMASATSVDEAHWLEAHGCDAIIAQGYEAGGHRGMFLTGDVSTQAGTMALVPQIVDAVQLPVIATGGIADARGIVAALALGASPVQIGTGYLFSPEAKVSPIHREALRAAKDNGTALTNVFTGRDRQPFGAGSRPHFSPQKERGDGRRCTWGYSGQISRQFSAAGSPNSELRNRMRAEMHDPRVSRWFLACRIAS